WLGEYPYNIVTAVEAKMGFSGGMEYPTITSISPVDDEKSLDMVIEHEVGHNWNYGILASNERDHPWMDEGINTYFDNRYSALKYDKEGLKETKDFIKKRIPEEEDDIGYRTIIANKKDQPIETLSEDFSEVNYGLTAYYKTGLWMKRLEEYLGRPLFDSCLHEYYQRWKFKHPYPEDFKKVIEDISQKNVDTIFSLLNKKGDLQPPAKKNIKVASFFNFKNTDKYNYIFLSPSAGYNYYDKFMIGGMIHNYTLPEPRFHFFAAPMYATGSKTFTGIARAGYNFMSYGFIRKAELLLSGEKFTMDEFTDSTGTKNYMGFTKLVPSVKLVFKNKKATSAVIKYAQWKTYFIEETSLLFQRDPVTQAETFSYPKTKRYLNQLTLSIEDNRVLYPYSASLLAEQAKGFARLAFEGKFFFNYGKGRGMSARLFAGKFIYLGNAISPFEANRYQLNMTGPNGYEDYTYSNYFIGRNEFEKSSSQQIMMRDGGFKVRTDMRYAKVGKTDDWLTALNLESDFPKQINPFQVLPFEVPLKVFLDIGTYAEAWKKDAGTGKFIYDAGLQVSLFKNIVNVYLPILYSKVYRDYFKQTFPKNKRFSNSISFSIDIQNFRLHRFLNIPEL
ncbi:MAG: M1 family aminopeptidase, partial [Ginsengibacter sp.]